MNHIHRVVWSEHSGTYVAVGEATPRRGKSRGGTGALLASVLMGLSASAVFAQMAPPPNTLPSGGQVARGQASLNTTGNRLDITQTSQQAVINWQSFSIGAGAQVNFLQPGANAVALNRVLGSDPSSIFGQLNANGQVFILNPNGVLFGSSARVDVGGLAASTLTLGDADFMAGRYRFTAGRGSVVNQGELSARDGGYIALLAPEVRNEGVISATLGTVALASGQAITLQTAGPLSVVVDQGALNALIENKHLVKAEDGRVLISARSSDALQRAVIRNDGSIEAKGVRNVGGVIRLEADVIAQTGSIDASSTVADGGRIDMRAMASDGGGNLTASGRIDASGQRGGSVLLTGNALSLLDANVNASGTQAGGVVLIGGDTQGRNADVPNARNTTVDAHSVLRADAVQRGQGGKVIVWADQSTAMVGSITARGGASGGDGGFIETSGKRSLQIAGARVDASAPKGANGQWLLDPSDVTIVHGSASALAGGVFDPASPSSIGDTEINAALNGGTDVTIQTTAGGGGSGAIVVNGGGDAGGAVAISNTAGGTRSLSLIADGAIDIRSGASIAGSSGNALNVSLVAAGGNTLSGTIDNRGGTTSLTGATTLYGTVKNGTLLSLDATPAFTSNYGKLDNVTLGGTSLGVNGELHIFNDLTLANGLTVNIGANNWYFNGQDTGQSAGTVHRLTSPGSATINLAGTNLNTFSVNGQTLQIESGITIQGYGSLNQYWGGNAVTNAGNLIANTNGQSLDLSTTNFTNTGTLSSTAGTLSVSNTSFTNSGTASASGGTLAINATNWSNPGKINADSGTLNLGGTFTVPDLTGPTHYGRTGGSVNITGTLDNTGTSVDIGGNGLFGTGGLTTLYGRILNGTVLSSDSTVLTSNYGKLDNVTLGGTSLGVNGELHIFNDLTLANGLTVNIGANNWYFNGQDTGQSAGTVHRLTSPGSATINLAGTNLNTFSVNGQTLQIESGITIQGYGSLNQYWGGNTVTNAGHLIANTGGQTLDLSATNFTNTGTLSAVDGTLSVSNTGFTNSGTASASGGTLAINATNWSNPGKINADSGTLNLGGTFTVPDLTGPTHYGRTGGSVNITGTLDNTGTSVDIGGSGLFGSGGLTALYGTIKNGTVLSSDSTALTSNYGKLDNVTLGGTSLGVNGELHIFNDLTLANGLTVNIGANNWYFNGQDTGQSAGTVHRLTSPGSATINLAGTNLNTFSVNGQTLQIESGITIQGYGSLNQTWGGNTVTNAGNLIANTSGQSLDVSTDNFSNSGAIQADADATFVRGNGFTNTGSLSGRGTIAVGTGASRLVNQGSISPGGTGGTGTLTINGDLQMATGASLNVELGGTGTGQFDRLVVSGVVSGDTGTSGSSFGTLTVAKTNGYGYVNANGDSFSLLTAASGANSGSFDPFTLARTYLTPTYGATQFSLLAVPRVLAISADAASKTYGAADPNFTYTVTGFDPATADDASTALSGLLGRAAGKDVGSYAYVLGSLTSPQGYAINLGTSTSFSITPASLALTANNASKVYDGGLTATTTAVVSSGTLFSGDTLTGGSFAYTNKNAGSGNKTVTVSGVTVGDGVHNSNYTLSYVDNTTSTITPYIVSATGSRSYDATTAVAASGLTLGSLVSGETLTLSGSGIVFDKNIGSGKSVAIGTLALGNGTGFASNYSLSGSGITFNITPRALAVSGVAASGKVYDAATAASLTGTAAVSGLLSDDVSVTGTGVGSFGNKNVGASKAVTVTGYTLTGADAANYAVTQPVGLTANITQASLAVSGVTASGKVYDATTTASLTGTAAVSGLLSDVVSVSGTGVGSFGNKNVGTSKAVTVTGYTLAGTDAANYAIVQPSGVTANITQASLAVSGVAASGKVYDATTTASLTGTAAVSGLLSDDVTVAGTGSGSFGNKNVGTGKAVTVTGYTLAGVDAANYAVVQPTGVTANITQANLAVTGVAASGKVYDATTTASLTGTAAVNGLLSDVVSVSGTGVGSFNNKNVGTGKAVTVTGYSLTGTDAANYAVVQPTGVTANITQASLAVSGVTAASKVYDATTAASLGGSASVSALLSDDVSVSGTGTGGFANKNVGTGKAVTVSGYTLAGADATNYAIVQPTGVTANITQANLAVSGVTASSKVYDATTTASLGGTASVSALLSDSVSVSGTAVGSFSNKNVGTNKAVTVTGYTLAGTDAANYLVVQPTGVTANITQDNLAVTGVSATGKVYDATTTASLTGTAAVSGLLSDDVSVSGAGTGSFANKNVGTSKAVTVTGYTLAGADAANYAIVQPTGVTANITQASLAVSGVTASSKVYDASTAASLTGAAVVSGLLSDDVSVSGTGTGSFANKNVGTSKAVTVTGYTLAGADAANYAVVQPTGVTANITQASLGVSGVTASSKVYDATTAASLGGTASVSPLSGDSVSVSGTSAGSFANKNVGSGKAVTVTGFTLAGADAANYIAVQPTGVTANITAANLAVTGVAASNKAYDATTAASLTGTAAVSPLSSDDVSIAGSGTGSFANKNVGTSKAVTVTGYTLAGADVANYVVVQPTGVAASITPASLSVSGVAASSKVYDATTTASLTGSAAVSALLSDDVTVAGTGSGSFADKNVGTSKAVTVTGYTLSGADALNYTVVQPSALAANITAAPLAVTGITVQNKVYDATTVASLSGTAAVSALGSDVVTVGGVGRGEFANAEVGTLKPVSVSGYALSGVDAGNYVVVQPSGLQASIRAKPLTELPVVPTVPVANAQPPASVAAPLAAPATVVQASVVVVDTPSAPAKAAPAAVASGGPAAAPSAPDSPNTGVVVTVPVAQGTAFTLPVPADALPRSDASGAITLGARAEGGGELPAWLKFDPSDRSFSGKVPADVHTLKVLIEATDATGKQVAVPVTLRFVGADKAL